MFNLQDNELLNSIKKKIDKEKPKEGKKTIYKKAKIKVKKDEFEDLKEHFLNAKEKEDIEFEKFKSKNTKEKKEKRKEEKMQIIKSKNGEVTKLESDQFEKYFLENE